jgi:hypothetical protein
MQEWDADRKPDDKGNLMLVYMKIMHHSKCQIPLLQWKW